MSLEGIGRGKALICKKCRREFSHHIGWHKCESCGREGVGMETVRVGEGCITVWDEKEFAHSLHE